MKNGQLLYISDYEALLYEIRNRQVLLSHRFFHQDEDYTAFSDYIQTHPPRALKILVNSRHEEYRQDRIPKLRSGDRQALLTHKRKRLFPATPYSTALCQGDNHKIPPQERILFSCLAVPDLLQPWIQALLSARVPITGICSLPLLSSMVLKNLPPAEQALLVTYNQRMGSNATYGLRQSFFIKQHLLASRLIPLQDLNDEYYAHYVLNEVIKTQQYLQGQGLASEDAPFAVYLLLPAHLLAPMQAYLSARPASAFFQYYLLDLEQVAAVDGIEIHPSARDEGLLYFETLLAWYALRHGKNHYAQTHEMRYAHYAKARRVIWTLSAGVALASLSYGGSLWWEAHTISTKADSAAAGAAELRARYQETQAHQRQLLDIPVDVIHIKNTVDVVDYIQALYHDPYAGLHILSKHLNDFPALSLARLAWEHKRIPVQKKSAASKLLNARMIRRADTEQDLESVETLTVEGQLNGFQGNTIYAVRTLKAFVENLQSENAVSEVKILESPMNIVTQTTASTDASTPFKLEIELRFGDRAIP
jgi:hypothetical protein